MNDERAPAEVPTDGDAQSDEHESDRSGSESPDAGGISRRAALAALGVTGLLGVGVTTATADARGQVGTSSDPVKTLYAEAIEGALASSELTVSAGGDRALVLRPGSVSGDPIDVVLGHGDNAVSGDGGVVSGGGDAGSGNTAASFASVGGGRGNAASNTHAMVGGGVSNVASGRSSVVGGGVSNEATFTEAFVGGGRDNVASSNQTTIGGGANNEAKSVGTTVAGGDSNVSSSYQATVGGGYGNVASGDQSVVSGGLDNEATVSHATVGGGRKNVAEAQFATIAGGGPSNTSNPSGTNNVVYDSYGTIGGGANNQVGLDDGNSNQPHATVGGGIQNQATGQDATVPGGQGNVAAGTGSLAAGRFASARDDFSFVWNDTMGWTSNGDFSSSEAVDGEPVTGSNTFNVSATGGVRFVTGGTTVTYIDSGTAGWSNTSSRAAKTNVDPIDPERALEGVESLEIASWEYEDEDGDGNGAPRIGPFAEEFHDAFDVGGSDEHINSIDVDGVALAAIQGLSKRLEDRSERVESQRERIESLEAENEALHERLDRLETHLAIDGAGPNARGPATSARESGGESP